MAKRLDRINVVDIEASCWEKDPPTGEYSEIIEIGIAVVDLPSLSISKSESILVRPIHSTVSEFCTKLTGIKPEAFEKEYAGVLPFEEALLYLMSTYGTKDSPWASYGDYDRTMFDYQCQKRDLPYPFGSRHINVKTLAALMTNLRQEIGMDKMLEKMEMPLEGVHHRAEDDARNIAHILINMIEWGRQEVDL